MIVPYASVDDKHRRRSPQSSLLTRSSEISRRRTYSGRQYTFEAFELPSSSEGCKGPRKHRIRRVPLPFLKLLDLQAAGGPCVRECPWALIRVIRRSAREATGPHSCAASFPVAQSVASRQFPGPLIFFRHKPWVVWKCRFCNLYRLFGLRRPWVVIPLLGEMRCQEFAPPERSEKQADVCFGTDFAQGWGVKNGKDLPPR